MPEVVVMFWLIQPTPIARERPDAAAFLPADRRADDQVRHHRDDARVVDDTAVAEETRANTRSLLRRR